MYSNTKRIVTFVALLFFSLSASAYHTNLVKGRVGYLNLKKSIKNGNAGTASKQKITGKLVGEIALTRFFTSNIATELGIGYSFIKTQGNSELKKKNSNIIPLNATFQFHLPIKNMFSPYVGVGYTYHIIQNTEPSFRIKNAGNLVYQAGIDLFVLDNLGLNLDCKYAKIDHGISDNGEKFKSKFTTVSTMVGVTIPF